MDSMNLALWKFKNIDGRLKYFRASDVKSSVYSKNEIEFTLLYEPTTNQVSLVSKSSPILDCTFHMKDIESKLKELNFYELKDERDCNANALIPLNYKWEN